MKLKNKLTIIYSCVSIVFIATILIVINVLIKNQFHNYTIDRQTDSINNIIEKIIIERETTNYFDFVGKEATEIKLTIKILDENGDIIYSTSQTNMGSGYGNGKRKNQNYTEVKYELKKDGVLLGHVIIGSYGNYYYSSQDVKYLDTINLILIFSGFGLVLISVTSSYIIAKRISTPIKEIQEQSLQIKNGNFISMKVNSKTSEIVELAETINQLSLKLKDQDAIKKRLASDYAHELKTPLSALQSNIEGMIDKVIPINEEKLEILRGEVIRINKLVNQINNIVIANDENQLNLSIFDLSKLIDSIIQASENLFQEKNLMIIKNLNSIEIEADKDKITQVFTNLLSNAIKYTNNGFIKIELFKQKTQVIFIIEDSGIGIDKKNIPYIFEHLYRGENSRSQDIEGFGIGLAIVKKYIELHNGSINVISEVNKGSKFTVKLKSY